MVVNENLSICVSVVLLSWFKNVGLKFSRSRFSIYYAVGGISISFVDVPRFLSYVELFLHLDSGVPQGVTQQVTHKVTQHLTGVNYGENVKLLSSMIQVRRLFKK